MESYETALMRAITLLKRLLIELRDSPRGIPLRIYKYTIDRTFHLITGIPRNDNTDRLRILTMTGQGSVKYSIAVLSSITG
jgi:hypothetical protein